MANETLIDAFYDKDRSGKDGPVPQVSRKSPKAKYQIFDESEFARGREVLGGLIVHGMVSSGGTDIDWMIEHNGGFVILEFKGFHNDKINIPLGQMIAYEKLHEKLNLAAIGSQVWFQRTPAIFTERIRQRTSSSFTGNTWKRSVWRD